MLTLIILMAGILLALGGAIYRYALKKIGFTTGDFCRLFLLGMGIVSSLAFMIWFVLFTFSGIMLMEAQPKDMAYPGFAAIFIGTIYTIDSYLNYLGVRRTKSR